MNMIKYIHTYCKNDLSFENEALKIDSYEKKYSRMSLKKSNLKTELWKLCFLCKTSQNRYLNVFLEANVVGFDSYMKWYSSPNPINDT